MAGGKVSSGKPKAGPPAHANRAAFRHNPSSRLTKHILSLPINDLCPACEEQIEWRKRFRKYKPLTVPKRCVKCQEKGAIKEAYHVICRACCRKENKCAKCLELRTLDVKKAEIRADKENKPASSFIKNSAEEDDEEEDVTESEDEELAGDEEDIEDSDNEGSDLVSDLEKIDLDDSSEFESDAVCSECEADLDVCVCEYDSDEDDYEDEYDEDLDDDYDEDCLDEVDEDDDDYEEDFDDEDELSN